MKKLYISCPVAERNYDDVVKTFTKMHKIAEAVFEQELKVINTASELKVDGKIGISEFADRIKLLSEADYVIGFEYLYDTPWEHCMREFRIAREFGIHTFDCRLVDVASDCEEYLQRKREEFGLMLEPISR